MRPLRLLLALLLLGTALSQVYAYRSGRPTQGAQVVVDQTALATLALSSTSPQFTAAGGTASISFQKGATSNFGLMRARTTPTNLLNMTASTVEMRDAFRVTNRSSTCQSVSVAVPGGGIPNLVSIKGRLAATPPGGGTVLAGAGGTSASTFALGAGQALLIDVRWNAGVNATAGTFRILVSGLRC